LDVLVKDLDLQDVRDRNVSNAKVDALYEDVQKAKSTLNSFINAFAVFGVVGVVFFLLLGIILS